MAGGGAQVGQDGLHRAGQSAQALCCSRAGRTGRGTWRPGARGRGAASAARW